MPQSKQDIQQIKFSIETDISNLKDDLREANKKLYPEGTIVSIQRGSCVWVVSVLGFNDLDDPNNFRAENVNSGKIHWFDTTSIIDILE